MPYAILSAVLIWLVLMPVHFRTKQSASKLPTLIAKVVPTLMAAAFAGAAAFSGASADAYARLLFIGLCICAMADLMIEIRFEIGGVLFFAGHMLYVAALLFYRALCWWNLAVFAGALAGAMAVSLALQGGSAAKAYYPRAFNLRGRAGCAAGPQPAAPLPGRLHAVAAGGLWRGAVCRVRPDAASQHPSQGSGFMPLF